MTTHKHWTHKELTPAELAEHKRDAAVRTLERLGYTHRGGVEWAPPLGPRPVFPEDIDAAAGGYPVEPVVDVHRETVGGVPRAARLEAMAAAQAQKPFKLPLGIYDPADPPGAVPASADNPLGLRSVADMQAQRGGA